MRFREADHGRTSIASGTVHGGRSIPLILFWIFALADLFRRTDLTVVGRVVWLIVIIMFPLLGPVTYLLVRPPAEMVKYRE